MAFVQKSGKSYLVKQGNTGKTLARFKNKKDADERVMMLHKKNKPKAANRGKRAAKKLLMKK
jgi:hypothetical protein